MIWFDKEILRTYILLNTQLQILFPDLGFKLKSSEKALLDYKKTGLRYGRLNNYPLIFDLQFSCSDVFTHVLPGSDPDKD